MFYTQFAHNKCELNLNVTNSLEMLIRKGEVLFLMLKKIPALVETGHSLSRCISALPRGQMWALPLFLGLNQEGRARHLLSLHAFLISTSIVFACTRTLSYPSSQTLSYLSHLYPLDSFSYNECLFPILEDKLLQSFLRANIKNAVLFFFFF